MKRNNKVDAKSNKMNKNCNSRQQSVGSKNDNNITSRNNKNVTDSKKSMGFEDEE